MTTRIAIVGGGIAGLATAYFLNEEAKKHRLPVSISVLEARPRLGGTIVTAREKGFVIEGGPDSFITVKPWALELCKRLGIEDRLMPTQPDNKKIYVASRGRLEELPPGVYLTVPTQILPFLKTRLLSPAGKMRAAMDLVLPRRPGNRDESIGSFIRRRLGREVLETMAEPMMGGIHSAEADRVSLQCTFPQFLQLERKHRSLILGMMKQKRPSAPGTSSLFMTLRGGMSELVDVLFTRMPEVTFYTNAPVEGITPGRDRYRLKLQNGDAVEADHLVLAVPAPQASIMLRSISPELSQKVGTLPYLSTVTVTMGFSADAVPRRLDATGFIIPRREGREIMACTWTSSKFDGRAPEGHVLLRCFLGSTWNQRPIAQGDDDLIGLVRRELRELMGIIAPPAITRVFRWPETNPIYEVGHTEKVRAIEGLLSHHPGLYLTGAGYRGVGIPDCVRDASLLVPKIVQSMTH